LPDRQRRRLLVLFRTISKLQQPRPRPPILNPQCVSRLSCVTPRRLTHTKRAKMSHPRPIFFEHLNDKTSSGTSGTSSKRENVTHDSATVARKVCVKIQYGTCEDSLAGVTEEVPASPECNVTMPALPGHPCLPPRRRRGRGGADTSTRRKPHPPPIERWKSKSC
jgi:hypothetical protein